MTGPACLGRFGISVTPYACGGVCAAVYPVTADIITPVRHPSMGIGLIFHRRLQFNPNAVAIVAVIGCVTHETDFHLLSRYCTVVFHEHRRMHIAPVRNVFIGLIMTLGAILKIFAFLFRMQHRWRPLVAGTGTSQDPSHENYQR